MLTIGADPEVFVQVPGKRQRYISAHDLVPGTKKEPAKLSVGGVQADGTAAEFNILPASTIEDFVNNIETTKKEVLDIIRQKVGDKAEFDWRPSRKYSPRYWANVVPESAKELGCDPDYDAYTGNVNPRPNGDTNPGFRTAGGHIHFGWTKKTDPLDPVHFNDCRVLTKALDCFLLPFTPNWDDDRERMRLYGKPGAFRPKPYGMEYRSPSNAWVKSPETIAFVGKIAVGTFKLLTEDEELATAFYNSTRPSGMHAYKNLSKILTAVEGNNPGFEYYTRYFYELGV